MTMAQFFFLVAFMYAARVEDQDAARFGAIIITSVLGVICYFFP